MAFVEAWIKSKFSNGKTGLKIHANVAQKLQPALGLPDSLPLFRAVAGVLSSVDLPSTLSVLVAAAFAADVTDAVAAHSTRQVSFPALHGAT